MSVKKNKKILPPKFPKEGEGKSDHPKSEKTYPSDHVPDHELDIFNEEKNNHPNHIKKGNQD